MKRLAKVFTLFLAVLLLILFLPTEMMMQGIVKAEKVYTIVLDPGHGGEALGGNPKGYLTDDGSGIEEKNLNMILALAMKEELEKYENVEVFLTHTDDEDLSLNERARFAGEKNADFLISLHFNMSVKHNLFGAEVWVSAFDEYYAKGMTFGKIQIEAMKELGLYSRGVKTKLMESRVADYYGIIRYAREQGVPCALIEHCHMDHPNDKGYYETEEKLQELGRADATAVAKYFGLKSEVLGVDYSDYEKEEVMVPTQIMAPDKTDPEVCTIEELSCNQETGDVEFALTGQDADSPILYYSYSLNGGITYSDLFPWQEGKDTIQLTINIPSGRQMPHVIFRVHNLYDRITESNMIVYPTFDYGEDKAPIKQDKTSEEIAAADSSQVQASFEEPESESTSLLKVLELVLLAAVLLFFITVIIRWAFFSKKKRNRRRK